ncbi:MAG: UbiA family prenyltransferase [Phycisphaerae bacterium]
MRHLIAALQLTRAALALTAVADVWVLMLLHIPGEPRLQHPLWQMLVAGLAALFLYGFGMSLNDLLDARRDRVFAPWRPLPTGRISTQTATILSLALLLLGLFFAGVLGAIQNQSVIPWPLLVAFGTATLIVFYNGVGKFLGPVGLITLGLIRGCNSLMGNVHAHNLLPSMVLMGHVTLFSVIGYRLESKRPRLRRRDYFLLGVVPLLLLISMIGMMGYWHTLTPRWLLLGMGPLTVAILFYSYVAWQIFQHRKEPRRRGEKIIRLGMFTIFFYDASILAANGQIAGASMILALLSLSVAFFYLMKAAGRGLPTGKPHYRMRNKIGPS